MNYSEVNQNLNLTVESNTPGHKAVKDYLIIKRLLHLCEDCRNEML